MTQGRLAGKVAIVTGAAPRGPGVGNGSAVAIFFAREGAKVVLVNRSASRAQELQHTIQQEGGECAVCIADVTRAHDVARMVDFATEHYGRLDILHNNVGHAGAARMAEMTEEEWDTIMRDNLKSMMLCCKDSIPHMRRSGGGSIINVSSGAGSIGIRDPKMGFVAYSTAKAGVGGLTRALAAELAGDGIASIASSSGWSIRRSWRTSGRKYVRSGAWRHRCRRRGQAGTWAGRRCISPVRNRGGLRPLSFRLTPGRCGF
jgi:NAD(P)-dependent dehydrogenase (short-subunit alcohol dehydrogenase family)